MTNEKLYLFLLPILLLFFVGCEDSTPAVSTPPADHISPTLTLDVAAITMDPSITPTPTPIPPTATHEPSLTVEPINTPTPISVATAPATAIPTVTASAISATSTPSDTSQANVQAVLEWILPQEEPSLLSISGGAISGFEVIDEYAAVIMGHSIAVLDTTVSPIAEEVARIRLPGQPSSMALSGRFWFLSIGKIISIIDLADPQNIQEVARIKGLGEGQVILGEDRLIYFLDSQKTWWILDVDQVLPAMKAETAPTKAKPEVSDTWFSDNIWNPHVESISKQVLAATTGRPQWLPEGVKKVANDLIYWETTGDGIGGGYLIRLNVEASETPVVSSVFRSFSPINFDVDDGRLYTAFSYEVAGGDTVVDVRDPMNPLFEQVFVNASNSLLIIDNTMLSGGRPGLVVFDLDNGISRGEEVPMFKENAPIPFTVQIETNENRSILFGLTGIYTERGGIAVYSIENPNSPTSLSFINFSAPNGPIEIKYAADRLYAYRTVENNQSVIHVFDVSDPANPEEMMSWVTEEQVIGLEVWQDEAGRHLMAALTPDEISIWDVSDPRVIHHLLGKLFAPPQCVVEPRYSYHRHTQLAGDWLFAPLGRCPTNRIDISDPANPVILDTLDANGPMIFEDGLLYMGGQNLRIYNFD